MRPVVWSEAARRDFLDILRYVAADSPPAAEKVVDAIEKTGNDLGSFATGRPGRVIGTYEKPVVGLPHVIAYAIISIGGQENVSILRVIHTARNWPPEKWPE
jgi:toxin ParE1/3/4